jgi:hypothetical protein
MSIGFLGLMMLFSKAAIGKTYNFNLYGFNSPPLWGVKLGVRGICSPAYAKISRRNLQYPAALPRGFFIIMSEFIMITV